MFKGNYINPTRGPLQFCLFVCLFIYLLFGLIQNIWIHIWCLTSCGVRSASVRAFNTCAREVREQRQARARDARANRGARARGAQARPRCARANKLSARANKLSKSQISSPNPLLLICARACPKWARAQCSRALLAHLARAPVFARASRARAPVCACACVKCSCACARTISTENVSYVLKNDNLLLFIYLFHTCADTIYNLQ